MKVFFGPIKKMRLRDMIVTRSKTDYVCENEKLM